MDQLLGGLGFRVVAEPRSDATAFRVRDTGTAYRVEASLPGIDVEKLDIDILGRRLSLTAETAGTDAGDDVVWHRRERRSAAFRKSLMLPEEVEADQVEAEYKNGHLTVTLPKAAALLPKKISVKAA
jgi:HSP20 family protein